MRCPPLPPPPPDPSLDKVQHQPLSWLWMSPTPGSSAAWPMFMKGRSRQPLLRPGGVGCRCGRRTQRLPPPPGTPRAAGCGTRPIGDTCAQVTAGPRAQCPLSRQAGGPRTPPGVDAEHGSTGSNSNPLTFRNMRYSQLSLWESARRDSVYRVFWKMAPRKGSRGTRPSFADVCKCPSGVWHLHRAKGFCSDAVPLFGAHRTSFVKPKSRFLILHTPSAASSTARPSRLLPRSPRGPLRGRGHRGPGRAGGFLQAPRVEAAEVRAIP